MSSPAVLYEKDGSVAVVSLNRPDMLNAYNVEMRDDLHEILQGRPRRPRNPGHDPARGRPGLFDRRRCIRVRFGSLSGAGARGALATG